MKRNLSFLWILLAAAVVFAGWFFPEFVLTRMGTPNFAMNYQTVEISSQASTDYFWRLKTAVQQQRYYTVNMIDPGLHGPVFRGGAGHPDEPGSARGTDPGEGGRVPLHGAGNDAAGCKRCGNYVPV